MNTTERLKASIEHWEENLAVAKKAAKDGRTPMISIDSSACSLCAAFAGVDIVREESCVGCPVHSVTGRQGCMDTPWEEVSLLLDRIQYGGYSTQLGLEVVVAVEEELDFLRSLLDKEGGEGK